MCMGFWVGIFNWFLLDLSFNFFIAGCISAGTSYLLSRLADDDGLTIKVICVMHWTAQQQPLQS